MENLKLAGVFASVIALWATGHAVAGDTKKFPASAETVPLPIKVPRADA
jgi:hypothetical protein